MSLEFNPSSQAPQAAALSIKPWPLVRRYQSVFNYYVMSCCLTEWCFIRSTPTLSPAVFHDRGLRYRFAKDGDHLVGERRLERESLRQRDPYSGADRYDFKFELRFVKFMSHKNTVLPIDRLTVPSPQQSIFVGWLRAFVLYRGGLLKLIFLDEQCRWKLFDRALIVAI